MGIAADRSVPSERDSLNSLVKGSRNIAHGQATVSGASTLRAADPTRRTITIRNLGTGTLYIGTTGVGTSDGFSIASGEAFTFTRVTAAILVNASGSCDVRWIEELAA